MALAHQAGGGGYTPPASMIMTTAGHDDHPAAAAAAAAVSVRPQSAIVRLVVPSRTVFFCARARAFLRAHLPTRMSTRA